MSVLGDQSHQRTAATTVHRQPLVRNDRSVQGYAVRVHAINAFGGDVPEHLAAGPITQKLLSLDLVTLAGDKPIQLRATRPLMEAPSLLGTLPFGLTLEITPDLSQAIDALDLARTASAQGARLVLADYLGTPEQDALLPLVSHVKVDLIRDAARLPALVARARAAGVAAIGEHADDPTLIALAREAGVELLQGPMFERNAATVPSDFTAGDLQCLELIRLLGDDPIDQARVVSVVSADPALAIRVLQLINSSALGLRRTIDSVHQAVVLLGPHHLQALAVSSLVDARPTSIGALWTILTRAITCRALTEDEAGYTVGLLSAVASLRRISIDELIDRTGVSVAVAAALRNMSGPYGPALAAVIAHEENDREGVRATGLEPYDVAHVYLAAVPDALATAQALSVNN